VTTCLMIEDQVERPHGT